MPPEIVAARHAGEYRVWLQFADGVDGELDLKDHLWGPMFEPLRNVEMFARLKVDPELDTVVWPNGADFAPEFLYEQLRRRAQAGKAVPQEG